MRYIPPTALVVLALFQAFSCGCIVQMAEHQSVHYAQVIIRPVFLYVILGLGTAFVAGCARLEMFEAADKRRKQLHDWAVIGLAVYSITASIVLFYTIKPWLRQILYL